MNNWNARRIKKHKYILGEQKLKKSLVVEKASWEMQKKKKNNTHRFVASNSLMMGER